MKILWQGGRPYLQLRGGGAQRILEGHPLWDQVKDDPRMYREVEVGTDGNANVGNKRGAEGDMRNMGNRRGTDDNNWYRTGDSEEQKDGESLPSLPSISQSNASSGSGSGSDTTRRPRHSLDFDTEDSGDMEVDQVGPQQALARSGGSGSQSNQSKETPISIPPTVTYGFQETHTTIIPYTSYVSVVCPASTNYDGQKLEIRLNGIIDPIMTQVSSTNPATANGVYSRGIVARSDPAAAITMYEFPSTLGPGPAITDIAWYRRWFEKMYQYYTVISCNYEITMKNAVTGNNAEILVGYEMDSFNGTQVGNILPEMTLRNLQGQKNIKWVRLATDDNDDSPNQSSQIIQGTFKPGMIRRNIRNDGDVKTWTEVGQQTSLIESLHLRFHRHPLAARVVANNLFACNVQIRLWYTVQYKDLIVNARYPGGAGQADITFNTPGDVLPNF